MNRRGTWLVAAASVAVLSASSLAVVATARGDGGAVTATSCRSAYPAGTVVQVALADAGGMRYGPQAGGMGYGPQAGGMGYGPQAGGMGYGPQAGGTPGMMRLVPDRTTVPSGTVTFVATNVGSVDHELLVLPAPPGGVGSRTVRNDGTVDESSSLGEASTPCGAGPGSGITPGTASWVTLHLAPGDYELICNVPWHYARGMYALLRVT